MVTPFFIGELVVVVLSSSSFSFCYAYYAKLLFSIYLHIFKCITIEAMVLFFFHLNVARQRRLPKCFDSIYLGKLCLSIVIPYSCRYTLGDYSSLGVSLCDYSSLGV